MDQVQLGSWNLSILCSAWSPAYKRETNNRRCLEKERSQPGEHKKGCIEGQLVLGDHGLDHLTSGAKRTWMHPLWTLQAVQGWGDRERLWRVKFTAWRAFSAAEAEALLACIEGKRLASQWCHRRIILESDCARVIRVMLCSRTVLVWFRRCRVRDRTDQRSVSLYPRAKSYLSFCGI